MVVRLCVIVAFLFSLAATTSVQQPSFVIEGDQFVRDGQPFQIVSGSLHYYRVPAELWADRLAKAKAMGLNTVQTYVPWNVHQPLQSMSAPDWSGALNLSHFALQAQAAGLLLTLRLGPYTCGEWEFGGFPSWLLRPQIASSSVRCAAAAFEQAYTPWLSSLAELVAPLLYSAGGPVAMLQLENQYGSYGNDARYLANALQTLQKTLPPAAVVYFSSDVCTPLALSATRLTGVLQTCNFGPPDRWPSAADSFAVLRQFQPAGPLMNAEYYTGAVTHWGDARMAYASTDAVVQGIEQMLAANASFNLYVFHGGSNFAFMNGANTPADDPAAADLQVVVQSFDYDAPLSEAGDVTSKYLAIRATILAYTCPPATCQPPPLPGNSSKAAYGAVIMDRSSTLWDVLLLISEGFPVFNEVPMTFEQLYSNGGGYGYLLYKTAAPLYNGTLYFRAVHDYAQVYAAESELLGARLLGVAVRNGSLPAAVPYSRTAHKNTLLVLVENHGRVSVGPHLVDYKGVIDGVRLDDQYLFQWQHFRIPLANISAVPFVKKPVHPHDYPAFFRCEFRIADTPLDTFLSLPGWTKGHVWINNRHVGRYWNQLGPQYSLYIPAPFLVQGTNTLVVFELLAAPDPFSVVFDDHSSNAVITSS